MSAATIVVDKRIFSSKLASSVPKDEFFKRMRDILLGYRGRVGAEMKNSPNVSILGTVKYSLYDDVSECIVMFLDIDKGPMLLEVLFYPEDIRNYAIFGVPHLAHALAKNETGLDCPISAKLLDLSFSG